MLTFQTKHVFIEKGYCFRKYVMVVTFNRERSRGLSVMDEKNASTLKNEDVPSLTNWLYFPFTHICTSMLSVKEPLPTRWY